MARLGISPLARPDERRPAAQAVAGRSAARSAGLAVDAAAPRQVAQQQALRAAFGGAAVMQRVAAGRYQTLKSGTLRAADKSPLVVVPAGAEVDVAAPVQRSRFKLDRLLSRAKDHTWVHWQGRSGWLRDEVLGPSIAVPAPVVPGPRAAAPKDGSDVRAAPNDAKDMRAAPTPSRAIGVGGRAGRSGAGPAPVAQIGVAELEDFRRDAEAVLEDPGVAPGASPLGLGRPFPKVNPADYRITVRDGLLHDRDGLRPLTVPKSPFVLSSEGQLFGGQGVASGGANPMARMQCMVMESHGQAEVGNPAWAGELKAASGRVSYINNQSGTYMLSDKANVNIIRFLYRAGVLQAEQIRDLNIERVYKPGIDRDGKLAPHDVLKN